MAPFIPAGYRVTLEPDLGSFTFHGRVTIAGRMALAADELTLNSADLTVRSCVFEHGSTRVSCRVAENADRQELSVHLADRVQGPATLTIEFQGTLNDRMAGFYRSGYKHGTDEQFIAVTQFEENDARRAFPCFDHPSLKATFDIEMVVDSALVAVSNTPVAAEEPAGPGKKRVRFARTPPMSTYLLFFGVGAFEAATDEQDPRVRALTVAGRIGQAAFGLRFGARALRVCESYFRTPYPLEKLDLIAVPDFAFGAMENWGAITFRENLLLHVPGITSRSQEQRICEVVAHEIAHQWFGDLVTPSDWKYLWLNESFATLFGYRVVDAVHPDWGVWSQFLGDNTEGALARDGMRDVPAIEIAGDAPVVINASNAPVLYSKGAAVLRQIEDTLGGEGFGRGLTRYLRDHACGNATSRDLWSAFEAESSRPITPMMASWIAQPGHPLVTVERRAGELHLHQKRFTYLPADTRQLWQVPVRIVLFAGDGRERTVETLLSGETQVLPMGEEPFAYKLNAGQSGFYQVRYAVPEDLRRLESLVVARRLRAEDRWGLQNDLFALVRSGAAAIDDYLRHLQAYVGDTDTLPVASIAGNLVHAFLVLQGTARDRVAAAGLAILEPALQAVGLEPRPGEPVPVALLRARILLPAALLGVDAARDLGARGLDGLAKGAAVSADIRQAVMQIGAWTAGSSALARLLDLLRRTDSEQERLNVLQALGWLPTRELLEEALEFALREVPSRNRYVSIAATAGNPRSFDWMWDWFQAHLQPLETLHRMHQERVIASIVPFAAAARATEIAETLSAYVRQRPDLADVVALSLERMEINQLMRERAGGRAS